MQKVTLTIGHNVGPVEALDTATICATVTELMPVDGYTAIPCVGMWQGMPENSTRIEFVVDEQDAAAIVVRVPELAARLNQEAIMCEVAPVNVSFVAATTVAA